MTTAKNHFLILVITVTALIITLSLLGDIKPLLKLYNDDNIFEMDQRDIRLIKYIQSNHLTKPSSKTYNLDNKAEKHTNGYSDLVMQLFDKKRTGRFIEAGAYDGEAASNTLYLEEIGWKGLLVECNPLMLPKLRSKNRKAWIADVCLSPTTTPAIMNFTTLSDWPASAKLGKELNEKEMKDFGLDWVRNKTWQHYQIPSFPFYSIIKAVEGFDVIDFLSLDVEGAEIAVLKTFPFHEILIKVIIVEIHTYSEAEKADLEAFMISKNYDLHTKLSIDHVYTLNNYKNI